MGIITTIFGWLIFFVWVAVWLGAIWVDAYKEKLAFTGILVTVIFVILAAALVHDEEKKKENSHSERLGDI